jgi:hypothetical protein
MILAALAAGRIARTEEPKNRSKEPKNLSVAFDSLVLWFLEFELLVLWFFGSWNLRVKCR